MINGLIPVKLDTGLVVLHTPEQAKELHFGDAWTRPDFRLAVAHSSVLLTEPICTCHAECVCGS